MRIVVVDDSEPRTALIKKSMEQSSFAKYVQLVCCDSADSGRGQLMAPCDLLILDVVLPKKSGGTPQAVHSVNLLSDICNPKKKYLRPRLVIGLTADVQELGQYQAQFAREATIVLQGKLHQLDWLDSLHAQIESILGSERKTTKQVKDRIFLSVHGIRTYGRWQQQLSEEISQRSRSFECVEIKHGFLDLFSFAVPFLRKRVLERAAERVILVLKEHANQEISVVAHSFGTMIVSAALRRYTPHKKLRGVLFCGSPIPSGGNIDHVVRAADITVNDCGTRDLVLIFARIFIWGLGDSGRVGFARENSNNFCNRYFRGGHSLYFKKFENQQMFYEKFWLRFIALQQQPERYDARISYLGQDLINFGLKVLTFLKPVVYVTCGATLLGIILARFNFF